MKRSRLICEFRLKGAKHSQWQFVAKIEMPQAPEVGELINVNGDPYRVLERMWTVSSDVGGNTYCYLNVVRWETD